MDEDVDRSRRSLLWVGPVAGFALAVPAALFGQKKKEHEAEEVTPAEDLMREHGLLKRTLLIYDEVKSRIAQQKEFPPRHKRAGFVSIDRVHASGPQLA